MGTYSKLFYHLVFSTKYRAPQITSEIETDLHAYLGGILKNIGGVPIEINGIEDHVHILTVLRTHPAVAAVLNQLKSASSQWVNERFKSMAGRFRWQKGYGAFTVSPSQVPAVQRYIRNQKIHHRKQDFQSEFRELLRRHKIEFDERFIWD